MTTRKSNTTKIFEHVCFHEKEIMDMHKILVGNGEPEKSLCRQVALIAERQEKLLEKQKMRPQAILNWLTLAIGFAMMFIALRQLNMGQKHIQESQNNIQAETKVTNDLLLPDTTEATVSIRGNVYIPILKTDSANIIHAKKMDEMYDKYMKTQK